MSINNSNKEFILNFYLANNKIELLENIINRKINDSKLEYYYGGQKIDIFCKCKDANVYVETQITKSDEKHMKYLLEIIRKVNKNAVIVWIALEFCDTFIKEVADFINNTGKNIEFYAISINKDIVSVLEKLNEAHVLSVIDKLYLLDYKCNKLKASYMLSCFVNENNFKHENKKYLSSREYTNTVIIKTLREKSKYLNIFKEKRTLDTNILTFGGGRHEIEYIIVYEDRSKKSYIGCRISNKNIQVFEKLLEKQALLEEKMGMNIDFDIEKLIARIECNKDMHKFARVDCLVEMLDKLIFYTINYTYYLGRDNEKEMFEQHQEGIL